MIPRWTPVMPKIVISYRRDDSQPMVGRIFDRLIAHYGTDTIFRDIDEGTPPGTDYRRYYTEILLKTHMLLAIVGPKWSERINEESDPVRVEVETALRRRVPVIPITIGNARMPSSEQLPPSLKDFAFRNAVKIDTGRDFEYHIDRLFRSIDAILGRTPEPSPPSRETAPRWKAEEEEARQRAAEAQARQRGDAEERKGKVKAEDEKQVEQDRQLSADDEPRSGSGSMASLADLPELVGFFSYSREDDDDSHGALSALRSRIQGELRGQIGRTAKTFHLWQDKEAIPSGTLWERAIKNAVAQLVFFIPIITPTVVASPYCRFELESFLARETELGRDDLVFPILYIAVPALEDTARRQNDPVLSLIARRQYVDWLRLRHRDVHSTDVSEAVERFCTHIRDALLRSLPSRNVSWRADGNPRDVR